MGFRQGDEVAAGETLEGGLFDHHVPRGTQGVVVAVAAGYLLETYTVTFTDGRRDGGPATVGQLRAELLRPSAPSTR